MYKNSFVHYVAKILVDIMFYCGIISCLSIPLWAKLVRNYYGYSDSIHYSFITVLFTTGLMAVYILFNLKIMFQTLLQGNPFVLSNVSSFRKIAVASFIIACIYFIKCLFWFTIGSGIIAIIFVIAGLFCLTLKDVFKQAVFYKEENDFTV